MNKHIINDTYLLCQETIKPAHSVESYPVEANVHLFLNRATEIEFEQARAMSWAMDKILNVSETILKEK